MTSRAVIEQMSHDTHRSLREVAAALVAQAHPDATTSRWWQPAEVVPTGLLLAR